MRGKRRCGQERIGFRATPPVCFRCRTCAEGGGGNGAGGAAAGDVRPVGSTVLRLWNGRRQAVRANCRRFRSVKRFGRMANSLGGEHPRGDLAFRLRNFRSVGASPALDDRLKSGRWGGGACCRPSPQGSCRATPLPLSGQGLPRRLPCGPSDAIDGRQGGIVALPAPCDEWQGQGASPGAFRSVARRGAGSACRTMPAKAPAASPFRPLPGQDSLCPMAVEGGG